MNYKLIAALAGIGAVGLALAALGPSPWVQATHTDNCTDATGGNVVITVGGVALSFQPHCVIIDNGSTVTWSNADAIPHDPGDLNDGGDCFRTAFDAGSNLNPGTQYSTTFDWDGANAVTVTTSFNGQVLGTKTCDADDIKDPDESTADQLVIPYICYLHPSTMSGTIIIQR